MSSVLVLLVLAGLLIAANKKGIKADSNDKVLGGVCSGIAQFTNLSVPLVRVLTVLSVLLTGGFVILLYVGLWITLPKQ